MSERQDVESLQKLMLVSTKEQGFTEIYTRYHAYVYRIAKDILRENGLAKDVTQEVFFKILIVKDPLKIEHLAGYLKQITYHQCLRFIENKGREKEVLNEFSIYSIKDQDNILSQAFEMRSAIDKIFNQLPKQRQQAFSLVYFYNYNHKDAAEEMGITINSIRTHLRLAVSELRKKLMHLR